MPDKKSPKINSTLRPKRRETDSAARRAGRSIRPLRARKKPSRFVEIDVDFLAHLLETARL